MGLFDTPEELERRARQAEAPDPMDLFKEDDWNEN